MKPRKFCLLATPRTGSHYLRTLLGGLPDVAFYGELFNPNGDYVTAQGFSMKDRDRDPLAFLAEIERKGFERSKIFGFKLMIGQSKLVVDHVLSSDDYQVILLSRENKLAQYSSFIIARTSGVWFVHRGQPKGPEIKVVFDPKDFASFMAQDCRYYETVLARIQNESRPWLHLEYGRMQDQDQVTALLNFMSIESLSSIADLVERNRSVRQNTPRIVDRFTNPETVLSAMRQMGREDWLTEAS